METCAIVKSEPNELQAKDHDRMPLIPHPDDYGQWLDPANQDNQGLKALLVPYPADAVEVTAANPLVNSPKNDRPECLEAVK